MQGQQSNMNMIQMNTHQPLHIPHKHKKVIFSLIAYELVSGDTQLYLNLDS